MERLAHRGRTAPRAWSEYPRATPGGIMKPIGKKQPESQPEGGPEKQSYHKPKLTQVGKIDEITKSGKLVDLESLNQGSIF